MEVKYELIDDGLNLIIDGKVFDLHFPKAAWNSLSQEQKHFFARNYTMLKTAHLPQMLGISKIRFETSYPELYAQIMQAILGNLPFSADTDGKSTAEYLKNFINMDFSFKDYAIRYPESRHQHNGKAMVCMSFGKDSLLTYGIAKEIGLNPLPVISLDNDCQLENAYKLEIKKQFPGKVETIQNNTGKIHRPYYWKVPQTEWGFAHLITEYCMNILPFAFRERAGYILIGNEKGCNSYYINDEGYKSYPVYDQTADWLVELTNITKTLTDNQLKVVSLIEPINELAIVKILHKRYPELGKYQMSCFPDETKYGKEHYWCGHCTKCARIYIMMLAHGYDPKSIGFRNDMLTNEYKGLYPIFGVEKGPGVSGWESSGLGKDEQSYAFLLATRKGAKGELIDLFVKEHMEEAQRREKEFEEEYFGIHESKTIPPEIKDKVYKIFEEELK